MSVSHLCGRSRTEVYRVPTLMSFRKDHGVKEMKNSGSD